MKIYEYQVHESECSGHLLISPCSIDTLQVTVWSTNWCMQQSVYQKKKKQTLLKWCLMAASG